MPFCAACATLIAVPSRPITKGTLVVGDTLNHNDIINADQVSFQEDCLLKNDGIYFLGMLNLIVQAFGTGTALFPERLAACFSIH